jgi:hypothetical protein
VVVTTAAAYVAGTLTSSGTWICCTLSPDAIASVT